MCRYAFHTYKEHYACFTCRNMFRQPPRQEMARPIGDKEARLVPCPQCGTAMNNMGLDFKAPRQTDVKQWQKVKELFAAGYSFASCGCNGPGRRAARLNQVKPFLAEQARLKTENARQAIIRQRAIDLEEKRYQKNFKRWQKRTPIVGGIRSQGESKSAGVG